MCLLFFDISISLELCISLLNECIGLKPLHLDGCKQTGVIGGLNIKSVVRSNICSGQHFTAPKDCKRSYNDTGLTVFNVLIEIQLLEDRSGNLG